ncbi:MAG TPA: TonB family protein, partial [Terriglobia bacterium]|nr:TonB family protein [Terriglobia bacterium]
TVKRLLALIAMLLLPAAAFGQSLTGVVTGRILGTNGLPAVGVRVTAVLAPQGARPTGVTAMVSLTETDTAGRYRLENIPPGRYLITAGLVDLATYYPGTPSMDSATAVPVAGNGVVSGIDFTMVVATGVTVSGRVVGSQGRTLNAGSGLVGLLPVGAGGATGVQTTRLNPDGSFSFEKVRPGAYRLELAPTGPITAAPLGLTVVDHDITGLEFIGVNMVAVTGSVVVEGGGLLPRLTVSFSPYEGGRNPINSSVGPTGTFTARLASGDYRVSWNGLPAGYSLKAVTYGSANVLQEPLRVADSGDVQQAIVFTLGVASPPPWVRVSGRVRDAGNGAMPTRLTLEPATAASVAAALSPSGSSLSSSALANTVITIDRPEATPDPDGSFAFPMVPTGSYVIRANNAPWPLASIVVANQDVGGIDLVVPRAKEVTGHVLIEGLSQTTPRLSFSLVDPHGNFTVPGTVQRDGTFKAVFPEGDRPAALNVPGFTVKSLSYGSTDLLTNPLKIAVTDEAELQVSLAISSGTGVGPGAGPGGGTVLGGVLGGTIGGVRPGGGTVAGGVLGGVVGAPPPPAPAIPNPVRVGGDVLASNCLSCPPPAYPALARAARISDTVVLSVTVTKDGSVSDVRVIRGHQLLQQAAVDAVRQWRYRPQMINGQPVEIQASVSVSFVFQ